MKIWEKIPCPTDETRKQVLETKSHSRGSGNSLETTKLYSSRVITRVNVLLKPQSEFLINTSERFSRLEGVFASATMEYSRFALRLRNEYTHSTIPSGRIRKVTRTRATRLSLSTFLERKFQSTKCSEQLLLKPLSFFFSFRLTQSRTSRCRVNRHEEYRPNRETTDARARGRRSSLSSRITKRVPRSAIFA